MTGWTTHAGRAAALPLANVDTDQLIPARFMSTPRSEGYGQFLLHDTDARIPEGTTILVAGPNFGSGSSREAAVYALVDFGIRAVVAPGFGDIFAANAANNGLLTARVPEAESLWPHLPAELTVDIAAGTVAGTMGTFDFELDETRRDKLIHGWDDIDLTARHGDAIARFRDDRHANHPWAVMARDQRSGHPTGEEP